MSASTTTVNYIIKLLYSSHCHTPTHTHAWAHKRNVVRGEGGYTGEASKRTEFKITHGIVCRGEFLTALRV